MKPWVLGGAAVALLAAVWTGSMTPRAVASSHREAPMITEDPSCDCTDVYAFVSPDLTSTVTILANYIPLEEPSGGPNYYKFSDKALYEIHIDNNGDANEDITFQWQFRTVVKSDATFLYNTGAVTYDAISDTYNNLNVEQRYTLTMVVGDRRTGDSTVLVDDVLVAPNYVGTKTFPTAADYLNVVAPAIRTLDNGIRVFAGPRDDSFFLNLGRAFDLINIDPVLPGGQPAVQGLTKDDLAGFNCHTLAIQVPITLLSASGTTPTSSSDPNAIIGVWSTASRPQVVLNRTGGREQHVGGAWVQVSRLGMPLVNEVVIPLSHKDAWNNSHPRDDEQFLQYVENSELAGIINALFGVSVPANPRTDLVDVFLLGVTGLNRKGVPCEYIRLNMLIPPSAMPVREGVLGGQLDGYPNGRRLTDDTIDISLRVVAGVLDPTFNVSPNNELGDTVAVNDVPFLATFPYIATPHDGVQRQHDNE